MITAALAYTSCLPNLAVPCLQRLSCLASSVAAEAFARSSSQPSTSDSYPTGPRLSNCRLFASAAPSGQLTRGRKISPAALAAAAAEAAQEAIAAAILVKTTPEALAPLERVDPHSVKQQSQFTIDGKRLTGDPGTVRYTAPYYIPEGLRAGMPRVLFTDPWLPVEDAQRRRDQAALIYDHLRSAGQPLTAAAVFERINSAAGTSLQVFGSVEYVKHLLEHMRRTRLLYGQRNPAETKLSHGHPDHPRLYLALPYQQVRRP